MEMSNSMKGLMRKEIDRPDQKFKPSGDYIGEKRMYFFFTIHVFIY